MSLESVISRGKNEESEMAADQMRKLFLDETVPREKLCTLFIETYDGFEGICRERTQIIRIRTYF